MKRLGLILLMLVLISGCASQRLEMIDAKIDPPKASPGDESVISVKVIDTKGVVAAVTVTVREYPEVVMDLKDNGQQGDTVAGDGVWSIAFDIPYEAPEGEYNWDFEAFDADGNPVKITTKEGSEKLLTAEAPVELVY
ncbi:MAG: choice-of-anchor X domain-containing protein [Planctomycetota bacterium]